jgi:eukaryotic-like serine/threonine-protein kinase
MIGQQLGHYLILAKIGAGGMGEVYRARDLQLDREVALKVLPTGMLADEAARKQFRKEALALAKLNHPNIETVFEFASQDGVDFLAMELIPGAAISERIKAGPLPQAEIARLALQLCEGLAAAHEHGIIHCDLKPQNLYVTPDGWLKILDFGLARRVQPEITESTTRSITTDSGSVSGTVPYMSPEQLSGEATDARTDIYSSGAVLYEMSTGQRAFPETQGAKLMGAILHEDPPPAISLNPRVSPGLDAIIRKAMEKSASQRYQTARELRVALEGLAAGSGSAGVVAAQAASAGTGVSQRTKWSAAAFAVALLLMIGLALGLNLGGVRSRVPVLNRVRIEPAQPRANIPPRPAQIRPAVAVLGFKNLSGRTDEVWLSTALSEMLTTEVGAGEKVRMIPGETVAQLKTNLSLADADSYGAPTLQKIRASIGSDYVLLGSYLALGNGQVRLDLRLQNTQTGELMSAMSAQGSEAEIAGLVSRIGATVRMKLGVGEVASSDAGMVQATLPANPEAARLYAEAIDRVRNYDSAGALPLIQKALALEPKFALSHMVMSRVWSNLGYEPKARDEAKTAFDLSANLSRREQLSIEGRYRETTHDWDKAIEIYKALWNFYPDEVAPGLSLASVQILASQLKDAQETVGALRNLHASGFDDIRIDINDARIAQTGGDFKKLLEISQRTAAKAQALGARALQGDMLLMEARAYEYLGDAKKGEQASAQAKDLYAAIGDISGVARAQNSLANILADEGNNKDARRLYEQALATSGKTGNKMEEAVELHNIAVILRDTGDLTAAKKMYQDALAIDREIGNKVGQAETLNSLANVASGMGDISGAETMYRDGLALSQEIGDQPLVALLSSNLGDVLYNRGDPHGAQKYFENAQAIYRQMGDKDGMAMTAVNIGAVLADQGDLKAAEKNINEAVALATQTGTKDLSGTSLLSLGQVQRDEGDLAAARKSLEQSLAIRNEIGEKAGAAETEAMLAVLALDENDAVRASALASKAVEEAHREKASDLEAGALAVLAEADLELNKVDAARGVIARAKALTNKSEERHVITAVRIAGARVTAASGQQEEALKTLEDVVSEMTQLGLVELQFDARLAIGEVERKAGKADASRAHLEALEKDASAKGFLLFARKSRASAV